MSVNGDMMVIRNGRSTSQVSVYNYPEHLNPFYEDDNHKRLRFWQINKSSKDGQGRRSSFSLGGLKDMWAFKSFRLKKKSSSLGINKTSESPPPLRRDIYSNENGYNTYDPRMRYTTGATNGSLCPNNAFQRNVPYRSSLQDMRTTQDSQSNGIGFNRNDRYRSTIQPATTSGTPNQTLTLPTSRRYVYRGSVTPQPVRNLEFNSDSLGMISRGSSQISVASTNPFDDEDDDDVVMGGISSTSSTPAKRPVRKKRRAPPPPIPVHQIIKEESSSASSTPNHKTSNTQPNNTEVNDGERLEFKNLTEEIESFVKLSNTDSTENPENRSSIVIKSDSSHKPNGTIPKSNSHPTRESSNSNVDMVIIQDNEPLFISEDNDTEVLKIEETPLKIEENHQNHQIGNVEMIHIRTESPRSTPERKRSSGVSSFRPEIKQNSSEKVNNNTNEYVVKVSETIKETPDNQRPQIAAKPNISKSPPSVSPHMTISNSSQNILLAETPETPGTRRKEIKTIEKISDCQEIPYEERGIDIVSPQKSTPLRQEVTIHVQRIVSVNEDKKELPVPAVRMHKQQEVNVEKEARFADDSKCSQTSNSSSLSEDNTKFEEKASSNNEEDLPTTISELQLIISEIEEVADRIEETSSERIKESNNLPKSIEALTLATPTVTSNKVIPDPVQIPPTTNKSEEVDVSLYRTGPSQWKQSTLAPLEPVPPEKRRSVKQIIDSINRNQQLLGSKKEDIEIDANNPQRNQSETNTNAMEQNLKSLAESQREMKRMLHELESLENNHERKLSNKTDENFQGILDTIVSTLSKETDKNSNGDVFKKCTITKEVSNTSRESSPTSSNLDWNPLPKPKRTNKNLSPDLEAKRNNKND